MTAQERAQEYSEKTIPIYGNNPSTMVLGQRQVLIAAFLAGAQSEWVKVEDGLPEIYTTCLTFSHNEIIMSIYLNDGVWEDEQTALIHDVTHWMPLPSKPII